MRPIFNESLCEKRGLWVPCTGPTDKHISVQNLLVKKVVGPVHCMGPTDRHISVQNLLVKKVVGPMHSALDPLTDNIPHENIVKKKKKKKKENTNAETLTRNVIQTLPNALRRNAIHRPFSFFVFPSFQNEPNIEREREREREKSLSSFCVLWKETP